MSYSNFLAPQPLTDQDVRRLINSISKEIEPLRKMCAVRNDPVNREVLQTTEARCDALAQLIDRPAFSEQASVDDAPDSPSSTMRR